MIEINEQVRELARNNTELVRKMKILKDQLENAQKNVTSLKDQLSKKLKGCEQHLLKQQQTKTTIE